MMNSRRLVLIACICCSLSLLAAGGQVAQAQTPPVTLSTLLREMADLERLAELASPAYRTGQFSSYDRASRTPDLESWFANNDRGQYLRTDEHYGRTEHVMMDIGGPGAIVRIWCANPRGTIRIYIDSIDTPTLEAPMQQLLTGQTLGITAPLAGARGGGYTLFLPIPYQHSCKVTTDADDLYYQINYRRYERGTGVEPFSRERLVAAGEQISQTNAVLANPRQAAAETDPQHPFDVEISPGQTVEIGRFDGERAITRLIAKLDTADDVEQRLRNIVLLISFDDEQTVEAPLGDFFGSAPGVNPFVSLPLGMTGDGEMWSHWVMPFRAKAQVQLRNLGTQPTKISGSIGTSPRAWTDTSMYFHATFTAAHDMPTFPRRDWNGLHARGGGKFVGLAFAIDNPLPTWWGEGGEKIFVDDRRFPAWFGTAGGDYFGTGWSSAELFSHAYHNQTRSGSPGAYGRWSLNRFHMLDAIPFDDELIFDMELWHWSRCKVNLSATAYWYGRPGASAIADPLSAGDVELRPLPPPATPRPDGIIEGEMMLVHAPRHGVEPQPIPGASGGQQLWWRDGGEPGAKLQLRFNVENRGRYNLAARFIRSFNYARVRLFINGDAAGDVIDLYSPRVELADEIPLGAHDLRAGENELTIEIAGGNPRSRGFMVGLDYLRLTAAEK